jgi:transcriptional regulator with XRE-family HTH domain
MSRKIPHKIKIDVIQLWLEGISRNRISEIVGIGKGTVTGIIQNTRLTMNDIDLLRTVAESLYKEAVDIYTFASAINLKRKFDELNWPQENIEGLLEELQTTSFKTEIEPKILLDRLMVILNLSINFNLSIEDSNSFLEGLEYKKADLVSQVSIKRAELDQVRQDICTEIEDSEDYKRYKNWKDERSSLIDSTREKDMRILELESINSEL